jgi:hypothetical protein
MKILYWLRTFLVSPETLWVLLGYLVSRVFRRQLQYIAEQFSIDAEFQKYLMLLPVGLFVWTINEARNLLVEDREAARILVAWPEYWKIKAHVCVALLYGLIFACASLVPWVTSLTLDTFEGMRVFLWAVVGELIVVVCVYWARIRVRESLAAI